MSACNKGDLGSIPESGRFSGEGNGNPFQYLCLENPMDRGLILIKGHLLSAEQTIQQQRGKQKDPFTITQVRDNDGLS